MKTIKYVLLMLICLVCVGCQTTVPNPPTSGGTGVPPQTETPDNPTITVLPDRDYDEEPDSIDGVDVTDLSALKSALDSVNTNYALDTYVYFNELAIDRVNIIYDTFFYCKQTTLYNPKYIYQYSDDFGVNVSFTVRCGS